MYYHCTSTLSLELSYIVQTAPVTAGHQLCDAHDTGPVQLPGQTDRGREGSAVGGPGQPPRDLSDVRDSLPTSCAGYFDSP